MPNRHIDDNHANLEEIEQEQAKNWFEERLKKAKKFQPLQLLNQKLRGLEVFESNNDSNHHPVPTAVTPSHDSRRASPAPAPMATTLVSPDPDDIITRSHWQRPTAQDACSDPLCRKRLGAANGQVNCRHCGKLFCDEHTMYQMKLSRSANHEPVRGLWYRVCETCYKSRAGYNDHTGFERSHFEYFKATRRKMIDKEYLETSRLETRLTRLTQLLADPPPPESNRRSIWSSITGDRDHLRALEQSVVPWQDDTTVNECPFCQQPFSQYALRRHHCRICGRVVCGDPATACSAEIPLDIDKSM
jgi:rabenosyn-5